MRIEFCPVCNANTFETFLRTKDYFFTKEEFCIDKCTNCGFKFTNPIPEESEIGKYYKSEEYLSHTNRQRSLKDVLYRYVKRYALRRKFTLIKKHTNKTSGSILDYGCATGDFLSVFKNEQWLISGIELDQQSREAAKAIHKLNVFAGKNELKGEEFDVITLWHVLEHISDLNPSMEFFHKHLKDKGRIFIAVPNIESWDSKKYGKYWAALDVPRHLYHFDKNTVSGLLEKHGFVIESILPMVFDSYFVSLLSEKYKRGYYNYFNAFINGLRSNLDAKKNHNFSSLIFVARKKV
jgi:SAM-dependent methyltransferase